MNWYLMAWKKYAEFSGRSRRKEYWMFTLFNLVIYLVLFVGGIAILKGAGTILYCLYALAAFIPSLSVGVRRLHDTGKSGWVILIALIPFVGGIILTVFLASKGDSGPNEYGPDPMFPEQAAGMFYGNNLTTIGIPMQPQPPTAVTSDRFCNRCGARLNGAPSFCTSCGAQV